MYKKSKGVLVLDSKMRYGVDGVYEDAKSRAKHQSLMQDYQELERKANVMRSKLEATTQKKLTLAAEIRFLRRRYKYLKETKTTNVSEEHRYMPPPKSLIKQKTSIIKKQPLSKKYSNQFRLPPVPELKPKKRRYTRKEAVLPPRGKETTGHSLTPTSILNQKGRLITGETFTGKIPFLDVNEKIYNMNDTTFKRSVVAFDLNQDSRKEAYLPNRAPIFDLNEISMGDEDFSDNVKAVKFQEAKNNIIRGLSDEQRNDLMVSICRNSREDSSRVGKQKITWQDQVAPRV